MNTAGNNRSGEYAQSSRQRRNVQRRMDYNARKTDATHADRFPNDRPPSETWGYQDTVDRYTQRPYNGPRRKDSRRPKKDALPVKEKGEFAQPTPPTEDSPPIELYDVPDMVSLNPDDRYNYINVDTSGFVTLLEESYRNLCSVDGRLTRQLTFGTYQHVMCEYLWLRLFDLASLANIDIPFDVDRLAQIVGATDSQIPQEIHEYLKNLGSFKDGFGNQWRINLADVSMPQEEAAIRGTHGGHFGPVTAENHNVYECYVSPLVTRNRVEAEIAGLNNFVPLPVGIAPPNSEPTPNLLGFALNIRPAHPDALARIMDVRFYTDAIGSRVQHSADLVNVVNTVLSSDSVSSKTKIVTGVPRGLAGTTATVSYVETDLIDQPTVNLRVADYTLLSRSQLTKVEIAEMAYFKYRRRRNVSTPGYCYLRAEAPIGGWVETINSNFNQQAPFEPQIGEHDELLEDAGFRLAGGHNSVELISAWIREKFRIKTVRR